MLLFLRWANVRRCVTGIQSNGAYSPRNPAFIPIDQREAQVPRVFVKGDPWQGTGSVGIHALSYYQTTVNSQGHVSPTPDGVVKICGSIEEFYFGVVSGESLGHRRSISRANACLNIFWHIRCKCTLGVAKTCNCG